MFNQYCTILDMSKAKALDITGIRMLSIFSLYDKIC